MNFFKFINVYVFLLSLAFGIFAVYVTTNEKRVIYVYPTQENADLLLYRDKADNCFRFRASEVACPADDEGNIFSVPAQS